MTRRTPRRYQFGAVAALAGAALFATSGIAAADTETGQHGDYNFKDNQSKPAATCVYSNGKLTKIVVKAPGVWWPDTDAGNDHEHGKIGWQPSLQISNTSPYGGWNTLYSAPTQVKTAYEDQPAYDPADKANLPTMTMSVNGSYKHKPHAYARIVQTVYWYAGDSSVMGSVSHEQFYYKVQGVSGQTGVTNGCAIHAS